MKNIFLFILLFITASVQCQYYYNDIVVTREIGSKMKAFTAANVQSVTATGYDPKGMKASDFSELQEVQANGTVLKTTTRNAKNITRLYQYFDNQSRLISSKDSTGDIQIFTTYTYDNSNHLAGIKMSTKDARHDFDETEDHQWLYNEDGRAVKMYRILNGTDTTEYRFNADEKGNVGDETLYRLYRRKATADSVYFFYDDQKIYYYYDDQHRLTDIVRYNWKTKRLLPDFMFEYDDGNRVIQKVTTVSLRSPDYFTWRYIFNESGLKTKEALFNKFKELKGRIDYNYTFFP